LIVEFGKYFLDILNRIVWEFDERFPIVVAAMAHQTEEETLRFL
jgi:hypothetical protein